jgi:HJR/Mrr/RecB family endonuclease
MVDIKSELGDSPFAGKKIQCNFSKKILKSLVGLERAENALKSISMSIIPPDSKKQFSFDRKSQFYLKPSVVVIQKAQSIGDFGLISNKLKQLKIETDKKKQASGVEKYIDGDDNSDDSDDPF